MTLGRLALESEVVTCGTVKVSDVATQPPQGADAHAILGQSYDKILRHSYDQLA